jgi:transposase
MDRASLERLLEQGLSLAEIGRRFDLHESTVSHWAAKYGLQAVNRTKHAPKGGLTRDELEPLVELGMSIAKIAEKVSLSKAAVRYWMKRYGLKTQSPPGGRRSAESQEAIDRGVTRATMICAHHGKSEFALDARGYYRCVHCRSAAVARRRRKLKLTLIREAGGACRLCGYSRCPSALEFHHMEPLEKSFGLSAKGVARSLAKAREEARKCVLLCATCHAEVEAGYTELRGEGPLAYNAAVPRQMVPPG